MQADIHSEIINQVFSKSEVGFFIYDLPTGKFSFLSESLKVICGNSEKSQKDLSDDFISNLKPTDLLYLKEIFVLLTTGKIPARKNIQFTYNKQDLHSKILEAKVSTYIKDGKVAAIGGFVEDITHRFQYEEALNKYNAKKNSVLEILGHDLKGPLGLIKNTAALIEEKLPLNDKENLQSLTTIQKISNQTIDLINNLSSIEYVSLAEVELKIDRINVVEKVMAIVDIYEKSSEIINRSFFLSFSTESIVAEIDEVKLIGVALSNLISNYIKFTEEKGEIYVDIREEGDSIIFSVKDNGIGIPDKFKPYLFDRFTEASRAGLRGERSIGLGLSIVKKVVELHGGSVWHESNEGLGSTFYMKTPKYCNRT